MIAMLGPTCSRGGSRCGTRPPSECSTACPDDLDCPAIAGQSVPSSAADPGLERRSDVRWPRAGGTDSHRLELLVITSLAGRDHDQPPRMQELPQSPVTRPVMSAVNSRAVLAEELFTLLLRQVTENHLRVIWILGLDWSGGHVTQATPGPGHDLLRQWLASRAISGCRGRFRAQAPACPSLPWSR